MSDVITEITPLEDTDCFYLIDRHKKEFDFPLHRHNEIELNFVNHCTGARRIVGDSLEVLGECDLALVGPGLEHSWEQHNCGLQDKREITIQFQPSLLGADLLAKNQMKPIKKMLTKSQAGLAFGMDTIMQVFPLLDGLTRESSDFKRLLLFLEIINMLACATDVRQLATSSFANVRLSNESRRVSRVEEEIRRNFASDLSLDHLAEIAGMSSTAFSRFFKIRTGRTVSDYIIEYRLGHAARMLIDSDMTVAEVCFACGFNNISNFNRIFKRKKGCTPSLFRENYIKTRVIV